MASGDWKLPDAQHKITEEKGLDIENEKHSRSVQARMAAQESFALTFEEMDRQRVHLFLYTEIVQKKQKFFCASGKRQKLSTKNCSGDCAVLQWARRRMNGA